MVHHIQTRDQPGVLHRIRRARLQFCTPIFIQAYVFFDQSLEEWINKKLIHRYDVLLPVAFEGHRPSTNHNSIVQLGESASGFVIGAGITLPDVLDSLHCLRVPECILFNVTYRVNGSDPGYIPVVLLSHESLTCQLE